MKAVALACPRCDSPKLRPETGDDAGYAFCFGCLQTVWIGEPIVWQREPPNSIEHPGKAHPGKRKYDKR